MLVEDHVKTGTITVPCGVIEDGENPEDACQREMWEELGIEVTKIKKAFTTKPIPFIYNGTKVVNLTFIGYAVLEYTGKIQNLELMKHRFVKFMSLKDLDEIDNPSYALYFATNFLANTKRV